MSPALVFLVLLAGLSLVFAALVDDFSDFFADVLSAEAALLLLLVALDFLSLVLVLLGASALVFFALLLVALVFLLSFVSSLAERAFSALEELFVDLLVLRATSLSPDFLLEATLLRELLACFFLDLEREALALGLGGCLA